MPELTTLDVVKAQLAIPAGQTASDGVLNTLIFATSADFLKEIDRFDFLTAAYTEVREGDGGSRIPLRHWPVTAVASVTVAGTALALSTDGVASGYYLDANLDPERTNQLYLAGGDVFVDGAPVVIAYMAGYEEPPNDVAQAVADWVCDRYKGRPGQGISSQRDAGGEHVAYEKEDSMPATTAACAERYKRTWPSLDKRTDDRNYRVTRINRTYTMMEKS